MKKIKLKTLTIIFGIIVALSAVVIGKSYTKNYGVAGIQANRELPSVNLIDLNKVLYIFFQK